MDCPVVELRPWKQHRRGSNNNTDVCSHHRLLTVVITLNCYGAGTLKEPGSTQVTCHSMVQCNTEVLKYWSTSTHFCFYWTTVSSLFPGLEKQLAVFKKQRFYWAHCDPKNMLDETKHICGVKVALTFDLCSTKSSFWSIGRKNILTSLGNNSQSRVSQGSKLIVGRLWWSGHQNSSDQFHELYRPTLGIKEWTHPSYNRPLNCLTNIQSCTSKR